MSRKRRRIRYTAHREAKRFTSRRLVEPVLYTDLKFIEDRRRFTPTPRNAASFTSSRHRLTELTSKVSSKPTERGRNIYSNPSSLVGKIAFEDPDTLICVRRKIRREVIHALKKNGKKGQAPKKFNYFSDVACKKRRK